MVTTLSVSEDTRKRIMQLKLEEGSRSIDELLRRLIVEHRKRRFLKAASRFREAMDEKGLTPEDLLR